MGRFVNPFPQYINISGSPIDGGFLKFFDTGTSNPKNVFSQSDLDPSSSIGNEVRLSGSGRVPALFLNGAYKVTLTDPGGNELDSADPIGIDTDIVNFDLWLNTNTYNIPDVVRGSDDLYYQSTADTNLGNDPVSSPGFWEQFFFLPTWNTTQTYAAGQLAIASDSRVYQSQVGANTGNDPASDDGSNWLILLQSGDTITSSGLVIQKIEAGSAGLSYENDEVQRWNWFFDTDESIKLNRFNSSGVLQDAVMSFNNTTGALTMISDITTTGDFTVNSGDVVFSQVGNAVSQDVFITSDIAQEAFLVYQDATINRWFLGQDTTNRFLLRSFNSSGLDTQDIIQVLDGTIDVILRGDLEFNSATSGVHGTQGAGGAINFNFTALSGGTEAVSIDLFDATTTTGARLFDIYQGDGTSTVTFQVDAETGSIHTALDRAGETEPGVKLGKIILSTNAPTGGEDGDLWLRF